MAAWRWQLRWGATAAEQRAVLQGDQLVPQPSLQATRATGIAAPPKAVWPLLLQLGQDRAGFYTYDWLERRRARGAGGLDGRGQVCEPVAAGGPVQLADSLELRVAACEEERALVLTNLPAGEDEPPPAFEFVWEFVLEPEGPTGTRLVVRERYMWPKWRIGLAIKAVAWVSFVMSRAMLIGIKRRAERAWRTDLALLVGDMAEPGDSAP
jgi:hypothetical protein